MFLLGRQAKHAAQFISPRRFALFVVLGVLLFACNRGGSEQSSKIDVVQRFYRAILSIQEGGVPSKPTIQRLSPLLSKRFTNDLIAAREAVERDVERTKGSEPPLVQGGLFFSLFEGAHRLRGIRHDAQEGANAFLVDLEYGAPNDEYNYTQWSDRALVTEEDGKWVVDDLELLGDWEFGAKGKLSRILTSVAAANGAQIEPKKN